MVAVQVVGDRGTEGVLLSISERPEEVHSALQALRRPAADGAGRRGARRRIIGFLVASLITSRVKRLAAAAAPSSPSGDLSTARCTPRGRDEIGDLGRDARLDADRARRDLRRALVRARPALGVFISLQDAVIVVGSDGDVRFANPAAPGLIRPDGRPSSKRCARGSAGRPTAARVESDHVAIGEKVFGIGARHLPAESAVLLVVRDRTEELRRDQAEREFVSNAAHELRNPIAGMSGAIEVLRSGAKDDPEARDHFLERLADDVDRVARLTKSLLTLARMEAIGEGEAEVVSIGMVLDESLNTAEAPEGVSVLREESDDELVAAADPGAPAPGGDRPADERVQAHVAAGHRYASRLSRRKRRDRDRGRRTRGPVSRRRNAIASSSGSIVAVDRSSERASDSAWRSPSE